MAQAKCELTIRNKLGLHARPAMAFVDLAGKFASDIRVCKAASKEVVDGKSIMQMLQLAATQGTKLNVTADGPDSRDALRSLEALVKANFNED